MTKKNALRNDPYTASSLLQKAIRRGDADMALKAAHTLYRQRGKAIWRRFVVIVFEDIGAGNPKLVRRVTETALAARQATRAWDGQIEAICFALAASPKSSSTVHLFSSAEAWIAQNGDTDELDRSSSGELISVAADPDWPLIERAAAMLLYNPNGPKRTLADQGQALRTVAGFLSSPAAETAEASLNAFELVKHPFVLLFPLIVDAMLQEHAQPVLVEPDLPPSVEIAGIPAYAFDKHTSVGKKAINLFALRSERVREALSRYVMPEAHQAVACMAAFHAESALLRLKLEWAEGNMIERTGFEADMAKVGCPLAGADAVLEAVSLELPLLNLVRSELLDRRASR